MLLALLLAVQLQQPHFRNTFATAAESTIDTISAVNLSASAADYDAAMKSAQTARENLKQMATEPGETDVVSAVNALYFAVSACHIQAVDNTDTTACRGTMTRARNRAMEVLGKHKVNGGWVDGPPV